jgi:hypothetical protein
VAGRQVTELIVSVRVNEKAAIHGITEAQLESVVANRHIVIRNRKGRAASHMMIGYDDQDRCLAVPVIPTDHPGTWRAVTAWYCKPSEYARLQ